MKYVFVITNHNSFLSSIGTMNYLNINHNDVLFYTIRNYKNEIIKTDWEIIPVDELFDRLYSIYAKRPSEIKQLIKEIDDLIEKDVKSKFELFIPHLSHPFYTIMATSEKCVKTSFVQEGVLSYKNVFLTDRTFFEKVKTRLGQLLKYRTNRIWGCGGWYAEGTYKQDVLYSYATNDRLFQYLPSINHIISWPKVSIEQQYKKDAAFFMFDGFVKNGFVESDYYLSQCKKLIEEYSRPYNYVKFHPNESVQERNMIIGFFNQYGKEVEELSNAIPFELVLASKDNLFVVGLGTSLLFTAHELGHQVICHDDWLLNSPKFLNYMRSFGCKLFSDVYSIH